MADQDFLNALNDSIDRLAAGQSVEDCLRLYPQHAANLRTMLETGRMINRLRPPSAEVAQAQARGRIRFEEALRAPAAPRRTLPFRPYLNLAATFLVILFIAAIGAGTAAQGSLPGDTLYGLKQITENLQLSLSGDPALQAAFNQRRIDEVKQVLALGRVTEVMLEGNVAAINGTFWLVDELPLQVAAGTPDTAGIVPGDRVRVNAYTTPNRELIASLITLIEAGQERPTPTMTLLTPSATNVPTETATATASLTPTHVPSQTNTSTPPPSATHTPSATVTSTVTKTATSTPSATPTSTASRTPTATTTATHTLTPTKIASPTAAGPTLCATQQPTSWVLYSVQPGDTLSGLAANRGITLEQLMQVNCLTDTRFIVVGDRLILPRSVQTTQPTQTGNDSNQTGTNNSGGGDDSSNNNDNGNDDSSGNDNGNDDSGGDDNGNDDSGGGDDD